MASAKGSLDQRFSNWGLWSIVRGMWLCNLVKSVEITIDHYPSYYIYYRVLIVIYLITCSPKLNGFNPSKNNQRQSDVKPSYSYQPEVDYYPIKQCSINRLFFLSCCTYCLFIVTFNDMEHPPKQAPVITYVLEVITSPRFSFLKLIITQKSQLLRILRNSKVPFFFFFLQNALTLDTPSMNVQ